MFVRSFLCSFVRSLLSVTFVELTSKVLVKVSLSEYISLTTHHDTHENRMKSFFTLTGSHSASRTENISFVLVKVSLSE